MGVIVKDRKTIKNAGEFQTYVVFSDESTLRVHSPTSTESNHIKMVDQEIRRMIPLRDKWNQQ